MLCHHLFYDHLDGTEVEPDFVIDARLRLTKQALIGQAGNTIATVASIAFGAAIGIAFVQVLWASLGQKSHSIREIQAIMECRTRPYSPGAWNAWGVSRKLTLLAVFGSLMALITIFAPSSLRTIQDFTDPEHCTVSRVDLAGEGYDKQYNSTDDDGLPSTSVTTSQELRKLVSRNLMDGAYLSPQNPLNRSVSYFLEFNAPAMNCTDTMYLRFRLHSHGAGLYFLRGSHLEFDARHIPEWLNDLGGNHGRTRCFQWKGYHLRSLQCDLLRGYFAQRNRNICICREDRMGTATL